MSRGPDLIDEEALINRGVPDRRQNPLRRMIEEILEYSKKEWGDRLKKVLIEIRRQDPFAMLIRTILSQNTSDENSRKAFENLSKEIGIMPQSLLNAPIKEVEGAIRVAGLYRKRARIIKMISKFVVEKYGGDLSWIKRVDFNKARYQLLMMPGVGYKTADIMLAFYGGHTVLPIDTHIKRIAARIGLTTFKASYEKVRLSLERYIKPSERILAHLMLIAFGRNICRAKSPLCEKCPIKDRCPWVRSSLRDDLS